MRRFARENPFLTVLIIAGALRLLAVLFSAGYMAHDDHFVTVRIAWHWHHEGLFLEDGTLRWEGKTEIGVIRSAVYNLFLLGLMKVTAVLGVEHLDTHMHFNRLIHALLSMLPVVIGYRYLREETDRNTALIGGMLLSAHFLIPFIAVRNLVEMVSADLLLPCLYFAHRSVKNSSDRDAIYAAIFGGLSLMIRMQVALSLAVVPIAMIAMSRKWRQAALFSVGVLAMVALQGLIDIWSHGKFLGSVVNYVTVNASLPPTIPGPWYRYILLIFGVMIPPFSVLFLGSVFRPKVIRGHLVLWLASLAFVIGHSAIVNKQERFIIPVFPVLIVLGCVGIYYLYRDFEWYRRWKALRLGLWGWFWVLNVVLLAPFTFNYAHRGAVDSLVYLSRQDDAQRVLFDTTERKKWIPYAYWDYERPGAVKLTPSYSLQDAIDSGEISGNDPPRYVVIFTDDYPAEELGAYRDKLGAEYEVIYHGKPSLMDLILHLLNPKYNHKNESWVGRLE